MGTRWTQLDEYLKQMVLILFNNSKFQNLLSSIFFFVFVVVFSL